MSDLVEHPDTSKNSGTVEVNSLGDRRTTVSLKTYQDIYHQITGRTEQIRKRYKENLLIELSEIEQLDHKIRQLCDIHELVASNDSVIVFHTKDRKEQYTSFARFRGYNTNTASPTVNLVLRYNFSIIPPSDRHLPQEYVVTIRLTSKVAAIRQLQEDAPSFIHRHLFNFLAGPVVEVTVDYADYVIARGFMEAVDEWVKGCKTTPTSKILQWLQGHSHYIPEVTPLLTAGAISYFAYQAVPSVMAQATSVIVWARFAIVFLGGAYIVIHLTKKLARIIEKSIDTFPELSYIKLNRGDELLIDAEQKSTPRAWLDLLLGSIGTVALGVISSKLEKLI